MNIPGFGVEICLAKGFQFYQEDQNFSPPPENGQVLPQDFRYSCGNQFLDTTCGPWIIPAQAACSWTKIFGWRAYDSCVINSLRFHAPWCSQCWFD
jgi:hypothetical protein